MHRRKKVWVIISFMILGFALGAAGYAGYRAFYANDGGLPSIFSRSTPQTIKVANRLDGTKVSEEAANKYPLAVVIENHPDARPQVGLEQASIIYEAIAEGGITRFMAIYGPRGTDKVGPVRSMRTFFLDWAAEYNAYLAHVGGNIDALDRIQAEKPYDLDQFSLGTKAYWREPKAGAAIEHTMFSSTDKLYAAALDKGYPTEATFRAMKFLNPENFEYATSSQQIKIDFSSASYQVIYQYDASKKIYLRSLGGFPHRDVATGDQLAPTNVIVQAVERSHTPTRINEESWTFKNIGEGKAKVFYGGKQITATWKKTSLTDRTLFYDEDGKEIKFLPGQFWYEVVPPEIFDKVSVSETLSAESNI